MRAALLNNSESAAGTLESAAGDFFSKNVIFKQKIDHFGFEFLSPPPIEIEFLTPPPIEFAFLTAPPIEVVLTAPPIESRTGTFSYIHGLSIIR